MLRYLDAANLDVSYGPCHRGATNYRVQHFGNGPERRKLGGRITLATLPMPPSGTPPRSPVWRWLTVAGGSPGSYGSARRCHFISTDCKLFVISAIAPSTLKMWQLQKQYLDILGAVHNLRYAPIGEGDGVVEVRNQPATRRGAAQAT